LGYVAAISGICTLSHFLGLPRRMAGAPYFDYGTENGTRTAERGCHWLLSHRIFQIQAPFYLPILRRAVRSLF
jgi:hypothetical protein